MSSMDLLGIGIDVVEISRIRSSLDEFKEAFQAKIFTETEREYCLRQKRPELHFAARFAAKEAIAKAFGTGIGKELAWLDLEITRKPSGEPQVELSEKGQKFAESRKVKGIMISLSHAKQYAAANAVILGG